MKNQQIPILCYHRVHSDDDPQIPAVVKGSYCGHVTQSIFQKQMKWLVENGFTTVTHLDIMKWIYEGIDFPSEKVVAIDFDDNRLNVLENALPIMREYGFTATVFIISELAAGNLPQMIEFPAMNWEHLGRLVDAGWIMGAHTATHVRLAELYNTEVGPEKVETELKQSLETIKENLGVDVPNFAYPTGNWSEQVEPIVKKYYRTARLWQNDFSLKFNTKQTDPYRLLAMNISMQTPDNSFRTILSKI